MRQYIIAGNWKMNKTVSESVQLAKDIVEAVKDVKKTEVVIAPTYLAAAKVADVVKGTNVKLAIQDIHWKDQGAYTGKVSIDRTASVLPRNGRNREPQGQEDSRSWPQADHLHR